MNDEEYAGTGLIMLCRHAATGLDSKEDNWKSHQLMSDTPKVNIRRNTT